LPALFLQLPHRRECDRNSIRCKCLKEHALDQFIHRQGADLLTQGTASLALVDSAAVDRIIAIRPRVPQAHATPAAPANSDALQQCRAPARRASVPRLVGSGGDPEQDLAVDRPSRRSWGKQLFSRSVDLRLRAPIDDPEAVFGAVPEVEGWERTPLGYTLTVSDPDLVAPALARALVRADADVSVDRRPSPTIRWRTSTSS